MFRKIISFYRGQGGISMVGLLMALAITGVVAIGATVASVQLLRAPEGVRVQGGNVITQQRQSLEQLQQAPGGRLQGLPMIEYAIIALDGDITLGGSSLVKSDPASPQEGDIYANGNINLSNLNPGGGKGVKGDAEATGTITDPNSAVSGTKTTGYSPAKTFSELDSSVYMTRGMVLAQANRGGTQGNTNLTGGTTSLGPKHITGNLRLSGNAVLDLTGPIFVDGTITMEGNSLITGHSGIAADGAITIRGNAQLDMDNLPVVSSYSTSGITVTGDPTSGILYAPNGPITLTGSSWVWGTVIGKSVSNTGNNTVEYPVALRQ
ncbi:MAG: hypothetical protein HY670_11920 [Chloroflexi bacterium]|nr:hypothetical protein [Chloroflexota bacterium]